MYTKEFIEWLDINMFEITTFAKDIKYWSSSSIEWMENMTLEEIFTYYNNNVKDNIKTN